MTPSELRSCALSAILDEPEKARDRFKTIGQSISGLFVSADVIRIEARGTSELVPSLRWLELVNGSFILYETLIPQRASAAIAAAARHYAIAVGLPFRLTFAAEVKTARGYNMKNFTFRAEQDAPLDESYLPMREALIAVCAGNVQPLPVWLTGRQASPPSVEADELDDAERTPF